MLKIIVLLSTSNTFFCKDISKTKHYKTKQKKTIKKHVQIKIGEITENLIGKGNNASSTNQCRHFDHGITNTALKTGSSLKR